MRELTPPILAQIIAEPQSARDVVEARAKELMPSDANQDRVTVSICKAGAALHLLESLAWEYRQLKFRVEFLEERRREQT